MTSSAISANTVSIPSAASVSCNSRIPGVSISQPPASVGRSDEERLARSIERFLSHARLFAAEQGISVDWGAIALAVVLLVLNGFFVAAEFALLAARRLFEPLRGTALFEEIDLAAQRLLGIARRPGRGLGGTNDGRTRSRGETSTASSPEGSKGLLQATSILSKSASMVAPPVRP